MFYNFRQNNSGGGFNINPTSGVGIHTIIEANSMEEANETAERIGIYFNGVDRGHDCSCCGDRWSRAWRDEGESEPTVYSEPINFEFEGKPDSFVHYLNGEIKGFKR